MKFASLFCTLAFASAGVVPYDYGVTVVYVQTDELWNDREAMQSRLEKMIDVPNMAVVTRSGEAGITVSTQVEPTRFFAGYEAKKNERWLTGVCHNAVNGFAPHEFAHVNALGYNYHIKFYVDGVSDVKSADIQLDPTKFEVRAERYSPRGVRKFRAIDKVTVESGKVVGMNGKLSTPTEDSTMVHALFRMEDQMKEWKHGFQELHLPKVSKSRILQRAVRTDKHVQHTNHRPLVGGLLMFTLYKKSAMLNGQDMLDTYLSEFKKISRNRNYHKYFEFLDEVSDTAITNSLGAAFTKELPLHPELAQKKKPAKGREEEPVGQPEEEPFIVS